ncbi:hypothetical protein [Staphylococcus capitis]|uniref:hypothetical protein n=1 Tax=Staphylococcus capitis TaxID=29388 RepID=UPI00066C5EFC|nr:hypothetical protein [Staphylococcus capitis]MCK6221791.1 hypothetical protein [Staphylococcus capitis]
MKKEFNFALSILFFWIKGNLSVDSRFVKVNTANVILGIFPAGRDSETIPLKNISSTKISSKYKIMPMIFGIIIMLISLSKLSSSFFAALVFFLIGALIFGSGILTTLIIQRAGNDYMISVPFFEKNKLLMAQDKIEEALAYDTDKTDLNQFFEKNK